MNDMSESMRAPWYHYVGAMLIGWAMAAFMYTYQRIRTLFCGSPLTEGTFHFTNFSILWPRSLFQHFHSMDFLSSQRKYMRVREDSMMGVFENIANEGWHLHQVFDQKKGSGYAVSDLK